MTKEEQLTFGEKMIQALESVIDELNNAHMERSDWIEILGNVACSLLTSVEGEELTEVEKAGFYAGFMKIVRAWYEEDCPIIAKAIQAKMKGAMGAITEW